MSEVRKELTELDEALQAVARAADACDHFARSNSFPICSWRIRGERHYGPTAGHLRTIRDLVAGTRTSVAQERIEGAEDG